VLVVVVPPIDGNSKSVSPESAELNAPAIRGLPFSIPWAIPPEIAISPTCLLIFRDGDLASSHLIADV